MQQKRLGIQRSSLSQKDLASSMFKFLSSKEIYRVSPVCKTWNALSKGDPQQCFTHVAMMEFSRSKQIIQLSPNESVALSSIPQSRFHDIAKNIKFISYGKCFLFGQRDAMPKFPEFHPEQSIYLTLREDLDAHNIQNFLPLIEKTKSLTIQMQASLPSQNFPNASILSIENNYVHKSTFDNFPNLKVLALKPYDFPIIPDGVKALVYPNRGFVLWPNGIDRLPKLPNIQILAFDFEISGYLSSQEFVDGQMKKVIEKIESWISVLENLRIIIVATKPSGSTQKKVLLDKEHYPTLHIVETDFLNLTQILNTLEYL